MSMWARYLDTEGHFTSLDPLCEKTYPISPYSFCAGDPVNYVDPDGKIEWPIAPSYKEYHKRVHLNNFGAKRNNHFHKGVDINYKGAGDDDKGAPVLATHSGKIVRLVNYWEDGNDGGTRIRIRSNNGRVDTFYMHLDSISQGLKLGDSVKGGQVIGTITAHLHYEIYLDGFRINPALDSQSLIDPQQFVDDPIVIDGGILNPAIVTSEKKELPIIETIETIICI